MIYIYIHIISRFRISASRCSFSKLAAGVSRSCSRTMQRSGTRPGHRVFPPGLPRRSRPTPLGISPLNKWAFHQHCW